MSFVGRPAEFATGIRSSIDELELDANDFNDDVVEFDRRAVRVRNADFGTSRVGEDANRLTDRRVTGCCFDNNDINQRQSESVVPLQRLRVVFVRTATLANCRIVVLIPVLVAATKSATMAM